MTVIPLASRRPESLKEKLERLATAIVDDALSANTTIDKRLDALKTVTGWEVAKNKIGEPDDADHDGPSLDAMRREVERAGESA